MSTSASDIAIRLWTARAAGSESTTKWNSDSVLVYMIADLVGASGGRCAEESSEAMVAHFDGPGQALVAAKRIQTSILEFLACRPQDRVGAAILIHPPRATVEGFSCEMVQSVLNRAKPGQILLAESVSNRLTELPGTEVRMVPAPAVPNAGEPGALTELVWMTPAQVTLLQTTAVDEFEAGTAELKMGATVMVDSPFARRSVSKDAPPEPPEEVAASVEPKTGLQPFNESIASAQNRPPAFDAFQESTGTTFGDGLAEFEEKPLITRTRIILGVVALVLISALIAVLYRPSKISREPIPLQTEQTEKRQVPADQPHARREPEIQTAQPDSKNVKTDLAKPPVVKTPASKLPVPKSTKLGVTAAPQIPDQVSEETRVKSTTLEEPSSYAESGGVSVKDIPALIRMAQQDAGAGNYDKARTEYKKILGLQPGNQDAREGLHKLDLIQKDE